jgi:hypothetical protein
MEYWNAGILGLLELDLFLYGWYKAENKKIEHYTLLIGCVEVDGPAAF